MCWSQFGFCQITIEYSYLFNYSHFYVFSFFIGFTYSTELVGFPYISLVNHKIELFGPYALAEDIVELEIPSRPALIAKSAAVNSIALIKLKNNYNQYDWRYYPGLPKPE